MSNFGPSLAYVVMPCVRTYAHGISACAGKRHLSGRAISFAALPERDAVAPVKMDLCQSVRLDSSASELRPAPSQHTIQTTLTGGKSLRIRFDADMVGHEKLSNTEMSGSSTLQVDATSHMARGATACSGRARNERGPHE